VRPPRISVIIPFHNRLDWLAEAVDSVLAQTYGDFELILVDDGSTEDASHMEVEDERVRLVRQGNQGVSIARNHGLDVARGEYVAFLDADDRWLPRKLERQLPAMEAAAALWSHTSYTRVASDGQVLDTVDSGTFSGRVFPQILFGCPIHTSSVMARRCAFRGELRFEPVGGEDPLLWGRFSQEAAVLGIDEPLVEVRVHEGSHWRNARALIIARRSVLESSILTHPDVGRLQRRRLVSRMELDLAALHLHKREAPVAAPQGHHGQLQSADYPYFRRGDTREALKCVLRAFWAWPANPRLYGAIAGYALRAARSRLRRSPAQPVGA